MPMSMSRVTAEGASLVCRVEKTKCPVSAALMAISPVSASRISPTDDVWRLAASLSICGEGQVDISRDLNLVDTRQFVFDRVFGCDDLSGRLVECVQEGVERVVLPEPVGALTRRFRRKLMIRSMVFWSSSKNPSSEIPA